MSKERKDPTTEQRLQVLTEAGYRCAVPTCRTILALDLHHIVLVSEDGETEPSNLIALCPTCHALHHRGTISQESIRIWKGMLISLTRAFDTEAIDTLLFLDKIAIDNLEGPIISGDLLMRYSRLIASGLVTYDHRKYYDHSVTDYFEKRHHVTISPEATERHVGYIASITPKGKLLVDAWKNGNMDALTHALQPDATA